MSANGSTPENEADNNLAAKQQNTNSADFDTQKSPKTNDYDPDEPIMDDGVNYDVYAEDAQELTAEQKELNFSSEDIAKRKKTEYFINVEGADKLKREAERREQLEKKKRLKESKKKNRIAKSAKVQNQKDDAAKLARKIKRQEARARRAEAIKKFFKRKSVWATISVVIVLGVAAALIIPPVAQTVEEQREQHEKETVTSYIDEMMEIYSEDEEGSFESANEYIDKKIAETKNCDARAEMIDAKAKTYAEELEDPQGAIDIMNTIDCEIKSDRVLAAHYLSLEAFYEELGDKNKASEYHNQYSEVIKRMDKGE